MSSACCPFLCTFCWYDLEIVTSTIHNGSPRTKEQHVYSRLLCLDLLAHLVYSAYQAHIRLYERYKRGVGGKCFANCLRVPSPIPLVAPSKIATRPGGREEAIRESGDQTWMRATIAITAACHGKGRLLCLWTQCKYGKSKLFDGLFRGAI